MQEPEIAADAGIVLRTENHAVFRQERNPDVTAETIPAVMIHAEKEGLLRFRHQEVPADVKNKDFGSL